MDDDSSTSSPVQTERELIEHYHENETAPTVGSFESSDMKAGIYGNYSPDFSLKERDSFLLQNDVLLSRTEQVTDVDNNEALSDVPIGFPGFNSMHSEWLDSRTCGAGLLHPNTVNGWNRSQEVSSNAFCPNETLSTAPQRIFSNLNNPYYFQHPLIHEQTDAFDQTTPVVHACHTQVESYHPLDASFPSGIKCPTLLHYQSDLNSATATAMAASLHGQRNLHMLPSMGGFIPLTHNHQNISPSFPSRSRINSSGLINQFGHRNITCNVVSVQPPETDYNPRELEAFSERFKQRRIKLGVTQADVGKALGNLKIAGVGSLSQSTICRFESLTLSHNNMVALKPVLQAWLEEAEAEAAERQRHPEIYDPAEEEKRRKRTSITDSEKRSLEAFFSVQPRPSSEKIAQIAEKLNLKKNVVRVWFCNQRQKQKRMKFSTLGLLHHNTNRT
ncbi:POU domain transcription factor, class 4 [Paragonimus westermani]|uniref:POU domain protein n=1 Tax=Paragonimus westermani TaxID=34504 RepID=A0A5J4NIR5_9TREM|nr:POU domain transcription factor, class 4 [Paragonimus westermani]KAA3675228.1 POU domain transcription factor, class 4 [Paragonimus westermani]